MIAEVVTRFLALRKLFWKSMFNIIDIILVALCAITLLFIIKGGCSHKGEEVFDLILLVSRYVIQIVRLILMYRKNNKNRIARSATVDFTNVRDPSVSMDVDSMEHGSFLLDEEDEFFLIEDTIF